MIINEEDYLEHYGILRRSGRYPWGSGETENQRHRTFIDTINKHRKVDGWSDTEIARFYSTEDHPFTTTMLRAALTIAKNEQRQANIAMAQRLKDKGYSNIAIGERIGINESSVRALLLQGLKDKKDILQTTTSMLRDEVKRKTYVDVGVGVERHLGISKEKLATAVAALREEGYVTHTVKVEQLGTGHQTEIKVLAPPGTTQKDVWLNRYNIKQITEFSEDGGRTFLGIKPPKSVDSKRVAVRYAEQGGSDADGVIYLRRGVEDLSLGASHYAQVRIMVDGTHYLKGMAMYKDNMPKGVDLLFNTNKSDTGNKLDAFKEAKTDADNPFGAVIRRQSGALNIVNEEGAWEKWSRNLSSQFLSKQSPKLAASQLNMTYEQSRLDLEEIKSLTNPSVRKKLLETFADNADGSSVHLKAAALPNTSNHVILPISTIKQDEIYAPNFRNGERVVLIRHPHGGIFEIPELTVNNKHAEARSIIGENSKDAVGIHPKVAEKLSGADFDGDTVLVIPNKQGKVKHAPALEGLKGFDPRASYPEYEGMKPMDARTKATKMGDISNLITDMTIRGAPMDELARAVRHSMVVIDAEKHRLDWQRSARENGIAQLKAKYQGGANAGAATLISRAKSRQDVPERKQGHRIDPATGKKIFTETGALKRNAAGDLVPKMQKSTKLAETDDARTLSSGTVIEEVYATHSNRMKDLANEARREIVKTKSIPYSPSARNVYAKEVAQLDHDLNIALMNAPKERQAQIIANEIFAQKRRANPDMEPSELKKVKFLALEEARKRTGAGKTLIKITQPQWDAIQAGAVSNNKLKQILDNSDVDSVRELATPRTKLLMTPTKQRRAEAMLKSGYTQAEVADALGVSVSTLKKSLAQ